MTNRKIKHKKRDARTRREKSVYLIVAEGTNKTETMYFSNFQGQGRDYRIIFVSAGHSTDAESLYLALSKKWKELELSAARGDKGFVVADGDNDKDKLDKIAKALKKNKNDSIHFIVSNPGFEVWFLMHFGYSSKFFKDCDEVIGVLKKKVSKYDKNYDVYQEISELTDGAIANAKKLEDYFEGHSWPSVECNPRTDVWKLVDLLRNGDGY
ncbi:MAG: RloB domain-containing protein [Butyrivibrio sp.]|uniref:RloB family protein n=1 Tax=Butyrivibrio sp. TaxID=28121 RepID=UPI001B7A4009|nr:RloB family protein [Butyrivibrio sp.]MBP3783813.1 RloB domain-containing protein [Butyrivibrio sp.]